MYGFADDGHVRIANDGNAVANLGAADNFVGCGRNLGAGCPYLCKSIIWGW